MKYFVLLALAGSLTALSASTGSAAGPVVVEMVEFAFHPTVIRLKDGQFASLRFVNRGQIAHQFSANFLRTTPVVINDSRMRAEAPGLEAILLQPGESATVQFAPRQRGKFRFACTIEGHLEAGMEGLLVVY